MSQFLLAAPGYTATDQTALPGARILLWSIASFTAAIIGWAGIAQVNETATAHGRVIPQRQLQVIGNLEGGVVAAILVKPGEHVAAGTPLVRLDSAIAAADFGRSSAAANALAARILRLEAEIAGSVLHVPAAVADAAPGAVAAEHSLWLARRSDRATMIAGGNARLDGSLRALAEAEATAAAAAEARDQAAREAAMLAPLVDKGIEPRMTLERARSALVQTSANAGGAAHAVARSRATVAEARAAIAGVIDRSRVETGNDLALARAELAGQSAGLPALQRRVERTTVRSPIAGTVQRVLVTTIGGSVAPGAPLVEVVPADGTLVVEARVRPRDIGFIRLGQPAAVKLTAYDSSIYGKLEGQVTQISPDAVTDDRGGESWYQVRIETPARSLKSPDGTRLPIGPGMVADIDLLGPRRTILSYLLSPVTKLSGTAFRER